MLKRFLSTGILALFMMGLYACDSEAPIERTDENIQNNEGFQDNDPGFPQNEPEFPGNEGFQDNQDVPPGQ